MEDPATEDAARRLAASDVDRLGHAEVVNERAATFRCGCCDAMLRVPAGTTVQHGPLTLRYSVLGDFAVAVA